jgi:decaprenylphospho-beta-D-erythro-pentofuranosid-2-ulose 2-reductase
MSLVLVIGAKSDIAKATSREYAKNGYDLYLAARNVSELEEFANDIKIRFQRKVQLFELDVLNLTTHQKFYENLCERPFGVIIAAGYLGEQEYAQKNIQETNIILKTNFTGIVSLLNIIANDFEEKKQGFIVGISSVAGDRGRKSNYLYGSAKAALTTYLSGLRCRLFNSGVHVMTVKPGFVNTKMTEKLNLPKKITGQPDDVARVIYNAQQKGKNVIYTPWIWKWIMLVIKFIPDWKFKKLNF